MGEAAIGFGAQYAPEALGFFLARSVRARKLNGDAGVGQIDGKIGDFGHDEEFDFASSKFFVEMVAVFGGGFAHNQRRVEFSCHIFDLADVLRNDEDLFSFVFFDQMFDHVDFAGILRCNAKFGASIRYGIAEPFAFWQWQANFTAFRGCNPAAGFKLSPGHVIAFGTDERKDIGFEAVFAHEGGCETETTPGLQFGSKAKYGRGKQVNFVVNNKSPIALIKNAEVGKVFISAPAIGQDIVRGNGNGPNFFAFARVFADLIVGETRFVEEFCFPLARSRDIGGQDQGFALEGIHRGHAHHGFTRAAGQDNRAASAIWASARVEYIDGLALIIAQCIGISRQSSLTMSKFEGSAFEISCAVFDRESDAGEGLFEMPSIEGQNADAVGVESLFNIGLDDFVAADLKDD